MKIRKMTSAEFWPQMKRLEAKVFKTQTYAAYEHLTPAESKNLEGRKKFLKDRIELFWGLFNDKNQFVGWTSAIQFKPNELYMLNSAVLPAYQRNGWYTKLAKTVMKEAKALGFQVITSNHVMSNNAVIIAKLKLGFIISGLEVSDEMGTLLKLSYFLNPAREEVQRYRTGQIHPTRQVKKLLKLK